MTSRARPPRLDDPASRIALLVPHEDWVVAVPARERAVLLDVFGTLVTVKEGERNTISWTVASLQPLVGRVDLITHSHPAGSSVGLDDLFLARFLGAREVNALTTTLRFRLFRLGAVWVEDNDLDDAIETEQDRLLSEVEAARDAGRMTDDEVDRVFYHVLWPRIVARFPGRLRYEVERRVQ